MLFVANQCQPCEQRVRAEGTVWESRQTSPTASSWLKGFSGVLQRDILFCKTLVLVLETLEEKEDWSSMLQQ